MTTKLIPIVDAHLYVERVSVAVFDDISNVTLFFGISFIIGCFWNYFTGKNDIEFRKRGVAYIAKWNQNNTTLFWLTFLAVFINGWLVCNIEMFRS